VEGSFGSFFLDFGFLLTRPSSRHRRTKPSFDAIALALSWEVI
jgi:hypothetical protein